MQLATEKVKLKSSAWMRARELQLLKMLLKFPLLVTAVVTKAGTAASEEQLLNILVMLVTAAVSNNGTVASEEQLLNI